MKCDEYMLNMTVADHDDELMMCKVRISKTAYKPFVYNYEHGSVTCDRPTRTRVKVIDCVVDYIHHLDVPPSWTSS